jgi:hypothetical protein
MIINNVYNFKGNKFKKMAATTPIEPAIPNSPMYPFNP